MKGSLAVLGQSRTCTIAEISTYCETHVKVFGNHKVAVPEILKMFNCEVDLSTVLAGMLARCHFFGYSIARESSSGKCSILTAKSERPSIYYFELVW